MSEQTYKQHKIDWGDAEILDIDEMGISITVECVNCYKGFMLDYRVDDGHYLADDNEWEPLEEFIKDEECKPK